MSAASILLPTILILFSKNKSAPYQVLRVYIAITIIVEGVSRYMADKKMNNLPLFHLNSILELACLSMMFYYLVNSPLIKKSIVGIILGFATFAIVNALFFQDIYTFNSYPRIAVCLLLIIYCIIFFIQTLNELTVVRLETYGIFWIVLGTLIYFAGNMFLFTFFEYLLRVSKEYGFQLWNIHSILNIIFNSLLALGIWLDRKPISSSS
jgi:hypothetical protein